MKILKSSHGVHKLKFLVFINIVFFIILSYICPHKNNENTISVSLENGSKLDISFDIRYHRTLAKYEEHNDLMYAKFQYKPDDNRNNNKLGYRRENHNTYERLKREKPNNIESYLNSFIFRHSKKSGLKKLDCFFEKELFNSFNTIVSLSEVKKFSKERIKKILYTKFGIPFIIICLLPLLVVVLPIMVPYGDHVVLKCKAKLKVCGGSTKTGEIESISHTACNRLSSAIIYLHYLFYIALVIIIVSFIIYMYIKVNKYQRIRSGMLK